MVKWMVHFLSIAFLAYIAMNIYQIATFKSGYATYEKRGERKGTNRGGARTVVYSYRVDGKEYRQESFLAGDSEFPKYRTGENFSIVFNPENPSEHILLGAYGFYSQLFMGLFGMGIFYFILFFVERKIHNKKTQADAKPRTSLLKR